MVVANGHPSFRLGHGLALNMKLAEKRGPTSYPNTPDGRYFVVRGRLWRLSNPALTDDVKDSLVKDLMAARRKIAAARNRVNAAKIALGERGAPWWEDGAPDFNRRLVKNTPYADWFETLERQHNYRGAKRN